MSRRAISVVVVFVTMLAALVTPVATMAVGESDAISSPVAIQSASNSGPLPFLLPVELAGGGSCGGAGSCPG